MALTRRQKDVLDFIAGYQVDNGFNPSYEEIARGLKLSSIATVADVGCFRSSVFPCYGHSNGARWRRSRSKMDRFRHNAVALARRDDPQRMPGELGQ